MESKCKKYRVVGPEGQVLETENGMLASFAAARMSETIVVGGLSEVGGEWRVSSDGDEDLVFRNGYEVSRG